MRPSARARRWIPRLAILAVLPVVFIAVVTAEGQQQGKVPRVGFLWESPSTLSSGIESFRRELRNLGWVEGQNIVVDYRWSEGQYDKLNDMARELVGLKVDLIVAPSSVYTEAAKRATSTIPIVFAVHADPLGSLALLSS